MRHDDIILSMSDEVKRDGSSKRMRQDTEGMIWGLVLQVHRKAEQEGNVQKEKWYDGLDGAVSRRSDQMNTLCSTSCHGRDSRL